MAEATVWPILADFLLVPLVLGRPRRAGKHLAGAVTGMALGGIGLYLFAFQWPARGRRLLSRLPTVHAAAIDRAEKGLAAHGLAIFIFQPISGVPFKVWALLAGSEGRSPLRAIPLFIVARAARMAIVTLTVRIIGVRYRPFLRDYFLFLMTIYLAGFLYVWRRLINA
jgi:membrane protein YqaA with SNARE-associated domain